MVLSEFTLALFEDSGWYKANYTALYNLKQNPLQWGKGEDIPYSRKFLKGLIFENFKSSQAFSKISFQNP